METLVTLLPVFKELRLNRRRPPPGSSIFYTRSTDGVELFCALSGSNPEKAVVVAHPAVVGGFTRQVVALADEISKTFSVALFDFRGHGRSTGRCPLGFGKVADDLGAVISKVRGLGFKKVGVAGFSLGAAAAFVVAARDGRIDALASIGCPPRFPRIPLLDEHPLACRSMLRLLGMRVDTRPDDGPSPLEITPGLPGFPKFLIFGEWEVASPDEIRDFAEKVPGPKRVLTVPGTWHADLQGREELVRRWFEDNL